MNAFVGFRLGKKDKDIAADIKRFTDTSKRMREAYRIAMAVERGEYVKASEVSGSLPFPVHPSTPANPIKWEFPKEPTVKEKEPINKNDLKKNMLGGF